MLLRIYGPTGFYHGFTADRSGFASAATCAEPVGGTSREDSPLPKRYNASPHHSEWKHMRRFAYNAPLPTTTLGHTIACTTTTYTGLSTLISGHVAPIDPAAWPRLDVVQFPCPTLASSGHTSACTLTQLAFAQPSPPLAIPSNTTICHPNAIETSPLPFTTYYIPRIHPPTPSRLATRIPVHWTAQPPPFHYGTACPSNIRAHFSSGHTPPAFSGYANGQFSNSRSKRPDHHVRADCAPFIFLQPKTTRRSGYQSP